MYMACLARPWSRAGAHTPRSPTPTNHQPTNQPSTLPPKPTNTHTTNRLPPLSKFYMRYMALGAFIVIVSAWQK